MRISSASDSISTFRWHQFSSPLLLSMFRNHRVSPEKSLRLQFLFLSANSSIYPSIFFQDPALPLYQALSSFVSPFRTRPRILPRLLNRRSPRPSEPQPPIVSRFHRYIMFSFNIQTDRPLNDYKNSMNG